MGRYLKPSKIRNHRLTFYKDRKGYVRTQIFKNGKLVSSFDSKGKTSALKKSRTFLRKR